MTATPEVGTVPLTVKFSAEKSTDVDGNISLRGSSNFQLLINGKPSVLSGNDALKQIPASTVKQIEIITNPSAKYDPDGVAGIINLIMKKHFAYILQILWLVVSILSLFAGIHKTIQLSFKESYLFFIFTLIALLMYFYRRNLRKTETNIAKLKKMDLIKRIGPAKGGYWEIVVVT